MIKDNILHDHPALGIVISVRTSSLTRDAIIPRTYSCMELQYFLTAGVVSCFGGCALLWRQARHSKRA